MAAKKVLVLLSSDRYAYPLIRFLVEVGKKSGFKTMIGAMFDAGIVERIREDKISTDLNFVHISKIQECDQAIRKSDLIIGMITDSLLLQVADSCISHRKTLISPARLNRQMVLKKAHAKENNVLILMDCGFSPGLDHITAKKAIDNIHYKGGKISSFRTYSGTFVTGDSTDNCRDFKLSEPFSELLSWGRHNNRHLSQGRMRHIPGHRLFERSEIVNIRELENTIAIPEGDSLYYKKIYDLTDAHTVVKGKLARKGFGRMWDLLIRLGFTDTNSRIDLDGVSSFENFLDSLVPFSESSSLEHRLCDYTGANMEDIKKLKWLGLFDSSWVEGTGETTPANLLQHLMEIRLTPQAHDRDRVVMEHQLGYDFRDEHHEFKATIILEGENQKDSALAKVIGYTCGAAAKSVLSGSIGVKGINIPIIKEIYDPILNELEDLDIAFHITEKKDQTEEMNSDMQLS